MKKLNYILILILILYSCDSFKEKTIKKELFSLDFKQFKAKNELELIDLDSVKNFSELRKKIEKITCKGKTSGLKFNFNKTNYYITGFANCPNDAIACYFGRNTLIIKNDTILTDFRNQKNNQTIENLKTELDSIISKTYNFIHNKDVPKPALIYLYIDDKYPISKTKKVLKEIAEQFKSINSSNKPNYFQYNILFESKGFFAVPPPPPPIEIDKE